MMGEKLAIWNQLYYLVILGTISTCISLLYNHYAMFIIMFKFCSSIILWIINECNIKNFLTNLNIILL